MIKGVPKTSAWLVVLPAALCIASLANGFSFSGPTLSKLDWSTRAIVSADIDADGRTDLVVINNDTAKVDILFQCDPDDEPSKQQRSIQRNRWEPVLEDAHFVRDDVVIAQYGYALAVGDMNNDGLPDLIYTGNQDPLTVRFQDEDYEWRDTWTFGEMTALQWISTLKIIDVNGEGRDDIVVLAEEKLLIFFMEGQTELPEPAIYSIGAQNPYGIDVTDIDGDGRLDIRYLSSGDEDSFRFRLQEKDGGFGPEQSLKLEIANASIKARRTGEKIGSEYFYIHSLTRLVESVELLPGGGESDDISKWRPVTYSSLPDGGSTELFALGDYNGDGLLDLVTGDAKGARIFLFQQDKHGYFSEPVAFPSLSKLSSISAGDLDGDGRSEVVLLSEDESSIGVSVLDESGRFSFPSLVPVSFEKPVSIAIADVNDDGKSELIALGEGDDDLHVIEVYSKTSDVFELLASVDAGKFRRAPEGISVFDMNLDGFQDFLMPVPRSPARVFLGGEDFTWEEISMETNMGRSQLSDLGISDIAFEDVDADGKSELIVTSDSFARALGMSENGNLIVKDQFNARNSEDKVSCPLLYDTDKDNVSEIFFYETENKQLQMLKRDELGVYRYTNHLEFDAGNPVEAKIIPMGTDAWPHMIFFSSNTFRVIPVLREGWRDSPTGRYETDLKDVTYTDLQIGDFNADGQEDLLLLDAQNHILEVLEQEENGAWKSVMHFTIFEENLHYQGRKGAPHEPREVVIADFTNDGKDDIALLIHDRVLMYSQD